MTNYDQDRFGPPLGGWGLLFTLLFLGRRRQPYVAPTPVAPEPVPLITVDWRQLRRLERQLERMERMEYRARRSGSAEGP